MKPISAKLSRCLRATALLAAFGLAQVSHASWDTWGTDIRHNGVATLMTGEMMCPPSVNNDFLAGYLDVATNGYYDVKTYSQALRANGLRVVRTFWTPQTMSSSPLPTSVYNAANVKNSALLTHGASTTYWEFFTNTINAITAGGIYVDLLCYNDGAMVGNLSQFTASWQSIATTFKNNDNVFGYELVNEPQMASFGNSASTYYGDMQSIGNAVQAIDSSKLIIVMPIQHWDDCSGIVGSLSGWYGKLVMSIHVYYGWGDMTSSWITSQHNTASNAGTPVMVTETSFPNDGTEWSSTYPAFAQTVMSYKMPLTTYWPYYLAYSTLQTWNPTYGSFMSQLYPQVLDGTYKIVNNNSGLVLDDVAWYKTNGSPVDTWAYQSQANEKWTVTYLSSVGTTNTYKIVNVNSGLALEDPGWSTANGTRMDQWSYHGNNYYNEQWRISPVSQYSLNGWFTVVNSYSGKTLEVYNSGTANGSIVDQWTATGGANQQWGFQAP
ncbi:MAG TPA: RICIN domain-containing protein [Verrucomicrobiae bacterium]|nr:RICIN domain-containing protein [Verrucomicrobiae bacterium]